MLWWPLAAALLAPLNEASEHVATDAALRCVRFVDHRHGWIVGDRGTILQTSDGGRTWTRQVSRTACNLNGIYAIDRFRAYVVGGQAVPHAPFSNGLILQTSDGGSTWQPISWGRLPRLYGIWLPDGRSGWAWGEGNHLFRSGCFVTAAGPTAWRPLSADQRRVWLAAAWRADGVGLLGAVDGTIALLENRKLTPVPPLATNRRAIRDICFGDHGEAWAVGDRGLILRATASLTEWEPVMPPSLGNSLHRFDWHAVTVRGQRIWIAGRPGHVILASEDGGESWQLFRTGQTTPLYSLSFVTDQRGVAVGALGTILMTEDGGRSWRRVSAGPRRAAVLFISSHKTAVPSTALATITCRLGMTAVLSTPYRMPEEEASRWADAAAVTEGSFDSPGSVPRPVHAATSAQLAEAIRRATDRDPVTVLAEELAILLALWRPDVVVMSMGEADRPLWATAMARVLEQPRLPIGDLPAWSPQRIYVNHAHGSVRVDPHTPLPAVRALASTVRSTAQSLLSPPEPSREPRRFQLAWARDARSDAASQGFWAGLTGSEDVRRPMKPPHDPTTIEQLRRAASAARRAQALSNKLAGTPGEADQLLASLGSICQGLRSTDAGFLLADLARQLARDGRWWLAAQTYRQLVTKYPTHVETPVAWKWLLTFYGSQEHQLRVRRSAFSRHVFLVPKPPDSPTVNVVPDRPGEAPVIVRPKIDRIEQVSATGPVREEEWNAHAREAYESLQKLSAAYAAAPEVALPYAALLRRTGSISQARAIYAALRLRVADPGWQQVCTQEQWLLSRRGRPTTFLATHGPPPHLDGKLDDPIWHRATFYDLEPQQAPYRTQVAFATNGRYLLLAARNTTPKPVSLIRPRQRDADCDSRDRIIFCIDVDRDYAVYYQFVVDDRGWGADQVGQDRKWNPKWFMAFRPFDGGYSVEVAIPIEELVAEPLSPRTVWAVNAIRVVPGQYVGSLGTPVGDPRRPDPRGLRLLLFSPQPSEIPASGIPR